MPFLMPARSTHANDLIDDELLFEVREVTGLAEASTIVREALKALLEREAAGTLCRLGGSAPDFATPPRR
jgi:Arc/MetJ family transcription regulator